MEEINRRILLDKASAAGAVFGLISGSYIMITMALSDTQNVWVNFLTSVLWFAKLVGCIWLMRYLMARIACNHADVDNSDTFRFGVMTAVFSAIITAAAGYISCEFIFPERMSSVIDQVYKMYGPMLDSNSMSALDMITENYSTIYFFSQLIWCTIYGVALSSILSRRIPASDPFKGYSRDDNETENNE